ncbi:MAG: flavin reductase [Deltaproteobacteria bacterium]|nr:MAG: flavin reductase [Deltaproteobacteria bacterium]
MQILGLQGSPRKNGNTDTLLTTFMEAAAALGASTETLYVAKAKITPCMGCAACEKTGFCVIKDPMTEAMYAKLRAADMVVAATPMYFYSAPAELKAFIDRSQALWSRRYRFRLRDPGHRHRKGVLLALGATKGDNLFSGIHFTAKYFFDAIDAAFSAELTYRCIEHPGDMQNNPDFRQDIETVMDDLVKPMLIRKTVVFAGCENAGCSQIAAAFAEKRAGDRLRVISGGSRPAAAVHPIVIAAMAEKKIDLAYRPPRHLSAVLRETIPTVIVTTGRDDTCPTVPGAQVINWHLPDLAGQKIDAVRAVRDQIEAAVIDLVATIV